MTTQHHRETVQTHTAKVFIQKLHISVDDLQGDELIVLVLYCTTEVQAGISATQQAKQQTTAFKEASFPVKTAMSTRQSECRKTLCFFIT